MTREEKVDILAKRVTEGGWPTAIYVVSQLEDHVINSMLRLIGVEEEEDEDGR